MKLRSRQLFKEFVLGGAENFFESHNETAQTAQVRAETHCLRRNSGSEYKIGISLRILYP